MTNREELSKVDQAQPGEITDGQLEVISTQLSGVIGQFNQVMDAFEQYAQAGGRDWETWSRILDHLARAGIQMAMTARTAEHPDWAFAAGERIDQAADATVKDSRAAEGAHRKLASSALFAAWCAGAHHKVSPGDWPDLLPELVLGAVRSAPEINDDPFMDVLRSDN